MEFKIYNLTNYDNERNILHICNDQTGDENVELLLNIIMKVYLKIKIMMNNTMLSRTREKYVDKLKNTLALISVIEPKYDNMHHVKKGIFFWM